MRYKDVPEFGALYGVKVVCAAMSQAGPYAAELMAEMGADVTWIENPDNMDVVRMRLGMTGESERRNMRNLCMRIPTDEGKATLLKMLSTADIFIESSKGLQYEKYGLSDDVLWQANPRLVIVHISGYGKYGVKEYVDRPSYDPVAQAFSGIMDLQGFPDKPPIQAQVSMLDYYTALHASTAALAALRKAEKTGVGDSIDVAQYEIGFRCSANKVSEYFTLGEYTPKVGNHNPNYAAWGTYVCKDGAAVMLIILGVPSVKRICTLLGLEYPSELFPAGKGNIPIDSEGATVVEAALKDYCDTHTASEMELEFSNMRIPCCRVMNYEDIKTNEQYAARETIIQWDAAPGSRYEGTKITGAAPVPRFKRNPQQIWRGCPYIGCDNEDVLLDYGLTTEQISELCEKDVIVVPRSDINYF